MMSSKLKLGVAALVAIMGVVLVSEHRTQSKLREQIDLLRVQVTDLQAENLKLSERAARAREPREPRSPAADSQLAAGTASREEQQVTNLFARYAKDPPKLTVEQAEAYLKANGRKASTLLAAYRTSGEAALLQEAMRSYATDPQVAFEAVFRKDSSPEERRQWLNTFEQSAPNNALPNYLSALEYFKAGQTDKAVQQLTAAGGKPQFQDYTLERRHEDEEAYLSAGYSTGAAKMLGSGQVMLPQLSELKQLGREMVQLSDSYRKAGDETSAQAVLQMAVNLGQSYGTGDCAISHLVGMAIERNALSALEPGSSYGPNGLTVQARLSELAGQKAAIKALFEQGNPLLENMSEQDWISYIDRDKMYGEQAAMQWAVSKFGNR